jgi:hypothetical protein
MYFLVSEVSWSRLVYCDQAGDCLADLGQVSTQCKRIDGVVDHIGVERIGICVPLECSDNTDCPVVGDDCGKGALKGVCNSVIQECNYFDALIVANCQLQLQQQKGTNEPAQKQIFFVEPCNALATCIAAFISRITYLFQKPSITID